jgi:hypothetical protein
MRNRSTETRFQHTQGCTVHSAHKRKSSEIVPEDEERRGPQWTVLATHIQRVVLGE